VAPRTASRRAQRGIALLGLLAVAVMVFAYVLTTRLNAASRFVGISRDHNAAALAQAKQALIGWTAINAATDNNPGRLPCPEAPGYFGDPTQEGIAAGSCTLPAAGRLPWRTLGLEKLVDAAGEPLWYAVSNGWALSCGTCNTVINSDAVGQLSLDGTSAVALIIAPGPAVAAQASAGCAAWVQNRPATGAPDVRNYLECDNATPADASFVSSAPNNNGFNDQVLRVTAADVMPALEAAIAERIQREIVPALKTVYTSSNYSGIPASSPMYPYAVPFSNPGTSDYQGASGTYQGLLPVNAASSMVTYASTPGNAVETQGYGYIVSQSCSWESTNNVRLCQGVYHEYTSQPWRPIVLQMTATFTNVAMGLRAIDSTRFQVYARDDSGSPPWSPVTTSAPSATMNSDGSVTVRVSATMPNIDVMVWDTQAEFKLRLERAIIADHSVVTSTDATYGWFTRNQWQRLLYYAVADKNTAGSLASFGCNNTTCLRFNEGLGCGGGANWCNIRALLVLGGASLSNASRPNGNLADYVEPQNADGGTFYEQHPMRRTTNVAHAFSPWNDRVILVDWLPSLPPLTTGTHPQVVSVSPLRPYALP
jgi:hypothetical protein